VPASHCMTCYACCACCAVQVADAKHPSVHKELREAATFRGPVDAGECFDGGVRGSCAPAVGVAWACCYCFMVHLPDDAVA